MFDIFIGRIYQKEYAFDCSVRLSLHAAEQFYMGHIAYYMKILCKIVTGLMNPANNKLSGGNSCNRYKLYTTV